MHTGTVKFYSVVKGTGLIVGDDNREYTVKMNNIKGTGLRKLLEGQKVQFEIKDTPKGKQAFDVEILQ